MTSNGVTYQARRRAVPTVADIVRRSEENRRYNKRSQARLSQSLEGSHGLEAVKTYQLTTMTKEKKKIERELAKIREGRYSQRGRGFATQISLRHSSGQEPENEREGWRTSGLPAISPRRATVAVNKPPELSASPTDIEEELELSRKSRELKAQLEAQTKSLQEKVNQFIGVDAEREKRKARDSPRRPRGENGIELNMDEVKESIAKRLASKSSTEISEDPRTTDAVPVLPDIQDAPGKVKSLVAPASQKKNDLQSVEDFLANPVFNPELYAPDGHVRTMHTLPNFKDSFDEAKKARYLRLGKGELLPCEVPLSVNEIFDKSEEMEAQE